MGSPSERPLDARTGVDTARAPCVTMATGAGERCARRTGNDDFQEADVILAKAHSVIGPDCSHMLTSG